MRSLFSSVLSKSLGLHVPAVVGIGIDIALAGCTLWLSPSAVDFFREPFKWEETFLVTKDAEGFQIEKTPTKYGGFVEIFFCQRRPDGVMDMSIVYSGVISERDETLRLIPGVAVKIHEETPMVVLTNLHLDSEVLSFFEVVDPVLGTKLARREAVSGEMDCSSSSVQSEI
ncbi:MAG: hypothetical protein GYB25_10925 [Rhodobacteraceae bacterium]|nr:hypothetical protein [Paracoccaceae bacterium]